VPLPAGEEVDGWWDGVPSEHLSIRSPRSSRPRHSGGLNGPDRRLRSTHHGLDGRRVAWPVESTVTDHTGHRRTPDDVQA